MVDIEYYVTYEGKDRLILTAMSPEEGKMLRAIKHNKYMKKWPASQLRLVISTVWKAAGWPITERYSIGYDLDIHKETHNWN